MSQQPAFPELAVPDRHVEPSPGAQERQRLSEKAARVLARLKATPREWVTNAELSRPDCGGLGGVRRKWELEQEGHVIEKRKVRKGTWEYRWMGIRSL